MADTRVLDPAPPASARTWRTGGALLLLSVVIGAVALGASGPSGFALLLGTAVLSAGLLVLALGRGSVTARRPLGTIALSLLAAWLLVGAALQDLVQANLQLDALTAPLLLFAYGDAPVQLVLALVAAVAVARAGVVPPAWRWAPAWSVLATATSWLLYQVLVSITIYSPCGHQCCSTSTPPFARAASFCSAFSRSSRPTAPCRARTTPRRPTR
jgi:hypothetical protein